MTTYLENMNIKLRNSLALINPTPILSSRSLLINPIIFVAKLQVMFPSKYWCFQVTLMFL